MQRFPFSTSTKLQKKVYIKKEKLIKNVSVIYNPQYLSYQKDLAICPDRNSFLFQT